MEILDGSSLVVSSSCPSPRSREELQENRFRDTPFTFCQMPWTDTSLPPGLTGGRYCSCLEAPSAAGELCKVGFCRILAQLSMQSSPTDWCPNWQRWARLHPSAAGSSISCQKPSLRVRVTPHPHPTHRHPSASAETFSNKKMASALWRNLDHTHTSGYHCSMQSVY